MANDTITIVDVATGLNIVREMTDEEQAQHNAEIAFNQAEKAKKEAEALALKETKISAYRKLGLTEEEIEALFPTSQPIIRPE